MRYLEISGGMPLGGEITIQGSKNAVLPVLAASMLGEGVCVIENCPDIGDVTDLLIMMKRLGCRISREAHTVYVDASKMTKYEITGEEASRIRSSVLFLGALLGKMGKAILPMPGGCAIGRRPIDLHIDALNRLGTQFFTGKEGSGDPQEKIIACADRLTGCRIRLALPSVGATENIILASVLAQGETVIENAACEPEIDELCRFLNLRGADIVRCPGGSIRICGVKQLNPVVYSMGPDRIVAGTYLLAAAATGGSVRINDFPKEELASLLLVLKKMGADYRISGRSLQLMEGRPRAGVPYLETAPYPGFPTDLQSQLMAVLCRTPGKSCIRERIFENRFATAESLKKMGARIVIQGSCAWINGVPSLYPAVTSAPDLRGGAALVIAALQADGCTKIGNVEYIERGYENICRDLRRLGADIRLREA